MSERENWRDFQRQLKKASVRKKVTGKLPKYASFIIILWMGVLFFYSQPAQTGHQKLSGHSTDFVQNPSPQAATVPFISGNSSPTGLNKKEVRSIMTPEKFLNLREQSFHTWAQSQPVHVSTSLNIPLQNFLIEHIDHKTAVHIGIVAMEPMTGRVLAMVSYDRLDPENNVCIDSNLPAASVFKVITAAAGIEVYDYHQDSFFTYNGRKHTLYKSQLKEYTNRYTHSISLEDSFAQSINPVFGKMGAVLGKQILGKYAEAFRFNHPIDFEVPVKPGTISLTDDIYSLAEVASGFNRKTRISPLHGALIASTILNRGEWISPTIIDRITDGSGNTLYVAQETVSHKAILPKTALMIHHLMEATVQTGTCRRTFRGCKNNPVLSRLNIGGKSGSINSKSQDRRFDWFVGFAQDKNGSEQLTLSIMVAHGQYIGTKASEYAKMAIEQYFGNYFANHSPNKYKAKS